MKKILLFGAAICCVFVLGSCKSKSSAYKTAYEQAKSNDNTWQDEEEEDDSEVLTTEEISYESVKQEKVKPASGEDAAGLKRYSVVIGSFKNRVNAYSLKERMIEEGYKSVVAENDFGMLRVIVASFDSKADAARSRDALKSKYAPNFHDAWLLERQY
ncbi:MAG: SPOR domain-containing protein [Tannerella sp.]|jgi:cell division protein FtsN|nr:SPOR domain-containing protein [Tannerella sp.]